MSHTHKNLAPKFVVPYCLEPSWLFIRSQRPWSILESFLTFSLHIADEIIGSQLAAKLTNAIKQKASQDEIQVILMEVSDEEHDQQFNPLKVQ